MTVDAVAETILRLRVLVSALGGSAHARWWRTEFLTPAGLRFLERLYPRTSHSAAIHATAAAARALHDSSIGRGGTYHLFRLPERFEGQVRTLAGNGFLDQVVRDLLPSLETREPLLARFDGLSPELPESEPGPQRIGSVRDLRRNNGVVARWAGAYFHAFRSEYRVFPYLEVEKSL